MRSLAFYSALLGSSMLFFLTACQKTVQPDPTLTLSQTEVAVPAEGGTFSVNYSITDPRDGAELSVDAPDAEWIGNIVVDDSCISFDVAGNETSSERTLTLYVSYPGIQPDAEITVVQAASDPLPFTITVSDITETSAVLNVVPLDSDMYFACFNVDQDYLDENNLTTDDAIFADDKLLIDTYLSYGYSIEELVYQGDELTNMLIGGLAPDTEQVVYAYGIDINTLEPLTEIVYERFKTLPVEKSDASFTFGEPEIDGPVVSVSITPEGYDGYWMLYALETSTIDPEVTLFDHCSGIWSGEMELWKDILQFSNEEILQMLCYQGQKDITLSDLTPNTAYTIAVFAVNEECMLNSEPSVLEVTTGSVAASDNVIDISVTDITGSTAYVNFTSSNNDPWAFDVYAASDFAGKSDEEILDLCAGNNPRTTSGSGSLKYTGLSPETEYMVVAFGYDQGCVTTKLFKETFTTAEAVTGSIGFELKYDAYYDAVEAVDALRAAGYEDDAAGLESSIARGAEVLLPAVPVTTPEVGTYYYVFFPDQPEYHLDDPSGYLNTLKNSGNTADWACYTLNYDQSIFAVGVAFNDLGEPGPVWVGDPFTLTKDGVSDPQGLIDFLYPSEGTTAAPQSTFEAVGAPSGGMKRFSPAEVPSAPVYNGEKLEFVRPYNANIPETAENAFGKTQLPGRRILRK